MLTKINDLLMPLVNWVTVISMAVLVSLVSFQVLNRFVLQVPAPWTEEMARYSFVYLSMFGIAKATREKSHIFVDFIETMVKGPVKEISGLLAHAVSLVFAAILLKVSITWTLKNVGNLCETAEVDLSLIYMCVPLGAFLMLIFGLENLIASIKSVLRKEGAQ
jgi:TRAP-type C4-dicarboxylate transport system permease small subunit